MHVFQKNRLCWVCNNGWTRQVPAGWGSQIRRVWSETDWPGVLMKGNNEGEDGGIGIASRRRGQAGTGRFVLPAQAARCCFRRTWTVLPAPLGNGLTGLVSIVVCHWRADEMKQALERLGRGARRARRCAWTISRAVARYSWQRDRDRRRRRRRQRMAAVRQCSLQPCAWKRGRGRDGRRLARDEAEMRCGACSPTSVCVGLRSRGAESDTVQQA